MATDGGVHPGGAYSRTTTSHIYGWNPRQDCRLGRRPHLAGEGMTETEIKKYLSGSCFDSKNPSGAPVQDVASFIARGAASSTIRFCGADGISSSYLAQYHLGANRCVSVWG